MANEETLIVEDPPIMTLPQMQELVLQFQEQLNSLNYRVTNKNFGSKLYQAHDTIASKGQFIAGAKEDVAIMSGRDDTWRFWAGAKEPLDAPFRVSKTGSVIADDVTVTGGVIKFGKTSFTDTTHAGYYISSAGIYFGTASDTAKLKYSVSTGDLEITGKITGSVITGSTLTTANSGQRTVLTSTLAQFYDNTNTLMVETYAYNGTYLVKGKTAGSNIMLDAGTDGYVAIGNNGVLKVVWDGEDLYPATASINRLGAPAYPWLNVYAENVTAGDVYGYLHSPGGESDIVDVAAPGGVGTVSLWFDEGIFVGWF